MCVLGSGANRKQELNISSLLQKCLQCFCVNLCQPVSSPTCFPALHSHLCLRFPKSKIDDPIPALTACLLRVWVKKASDKLSSYLACRLKRWWILAPIAHSLSYSPYTLDFASHVWLFLWSTFEIQKCKASKTCQKITYWLLGRLFFVKVEERWG